jgi:hypothetical protein
LANLTSLNLTSIENYVFGDASDTTSTKRSTTGCKAYPGDASWPSNLEWTVLDLLLGGALIKSVPVAAPCFSSWPQYNNDTCTTITADWNTPSFQ